MTFGVPQVLLWPGAPLKTTSPHTVSPHLHLPGPNLTGWFWFAATDCTPVQLSTQASLGLALAVPHPHRWTYWACPVPLPTSLPPHYTKDNWNLRMFPKQPSNLLWYDIFTCPGTRGFIDAGNFILCRYVCLVLLCLNQDIYFFHLRWPSTIIGSPLPILPPTLLLCLPAPDPPPPPSGVMWTHSCTYLAPGCLMLLSSTETLVSRANSTVLWNSCTTHYTHSTTYIFRKAQYIYAAAGNHPHDKPCLLQLVRAMSLWSQKGGQVVRLRPVAHSAESSAVRRLQRTSCLSTCPGTDQNVSVLWLVVCLCR